MTLNARSSVAAWVQMAPDAIPIFEELGIDYCCGGAASLEEACREHGIDVEEVVARLEDRKPAAAASDDWKSLTPDKLCDHIEEVHHAYLRKEFPRLRALTQKVVEVHGVRHPELKKIAAALVNLCDELTSHMEKEEMVLFPAVRELCAGTTPVSFHCGTLGNPIRVMQMEHESAGAALASLQELSSGYKLPEDACASYQALYEGLKQMESDLHLHIHKENNVLFPAVLAREKSVSGH